MSASKFDDFNGYYCVRFSGIEFARFAPSTIWSEYAGSMKGVKDFSYTFVPTETGPEPLPPRLLKHLVMPKHEIPDVDVTSPWGSPIWCKGSSVPGYVHEIDHTHWHCNSCGHVAEIPEEKS